MVEAENKPENSITVRVAHDLRRQILEVPSLFRVINSYYDKKTNIQKNLKPLIMKKFKEGMKTIELDKDWLFSLPTALSTLNEEVINHKDSFRFPDSVILFEAWMNLGIEALFPRYVLQFKFPGFLSGEKNRNVFQFIYATSRGFGFPIYFGPEFYGYKLTIGKILEPLFRWSHRVCHAINMLIYAIGDKKIKMKRHHPGEFESVIISEYKDNVFKGIDTLVHGYFTNDPKTLGTYDSIKELLHDSVFSYTIGDHAMGIDKNNKLNTRDLPLITHDSIVKKYDIDFYSYIQKLLDVNRLLIRKISFYKKQKRVLISGLKIVDKIKFRLEETKRFAKRFARMAQNLSEKYPEIDKLSHYNALMEKLRNLLFTKPLYMHTVHIPKPGEKYIRSSKQSDEDFDEFEQESANSILLSFIKHYEKEQDFIFEENEVEAAIKELRDHMAKMWLYFKERQFRYAVQKLNELSSLSLSDSEYREKIQMYLEKIIPIISIYEIFHRPLSESVYPESIPQTQRFGAYLARFFTSKYNPIGINIMKLFNRLAYFNWIYFIHKKKLNYKQYFDIVLRLPIWKHIPTEIKMKILSYNRE